MYANINKRGSADVCTPLFWNNDMKPIVNVFKKWIYRTIGRVFKPKVLSLTGLYVMETKSLLIHKKNEW